MTEPREWGENGPETDCLAWMIWGGSDACWEHLAWRDHADGWDGVWSGGYYLAGKPIDDLDVVAVTHWLPMPAAAGWSL